MSSIAENMRKRAAETSELHLRLKHFIGECSRLAGHCAFQAGLRASYGYGDAESEALIARKQRRQRMYLKAMRKAQKILNRIRKGAP
jgi:hypothetical protein